MQPPFSPVSDENTEFEVITLVAEEAVARLDRWLAGVLENRSRSEIQRWIEADLVTVGGRIAHASQRVAPGQEVTIELPPIESYEVLPEPIPLSVVYEDANLLVIDKPAGMVVHPGAGHMHGTLVSAILYHCSDLEGVGGAHRPGIVHRLDMDTSGLIVVAKNDATHRDLQAQFKAREVKKQYLALVYGRYKARAEIRAAIGRDPRDRKRMAVVNATEGRAAVTGVEPLQYYRGGTAGQTYTLVRCVPLTGRTHQIRVHLQHVGHPVTGDRLYGGRYRPPASLPRQFLHASALRFRRPPDGQEAVFESPLPEDLAAFLARLQPDD